MTLPATLPAEFIGKGRRFRMGALVTACSTFRDEYKDDILRLGGLRATIEHYLPEQCDVIGYRGDTLPEEMLEWLATNPSITCWQVWYPPKSEYTTFYFPTITEAVFFKLTWS